MEITVVCEGGPEFTGKTARHLVRQMAKDGWNAPDTKREYMEQVAERVMGMTGTRPREDASGFLIDLQSAGLIEIQFKYVSEEVLFELLDCDAE